MKYAYARVSAADQNLNRQIDSFIEYGVSKNNIFADKKSGKDFNRENYIKLAKKLKKGDLLIIKSIDRLGRNYDMIIEEWTRVTKTIGADIIVMDMPMLDTRSRSENLTGKFISDIVLQLLSYVAQKERENINARQKEGIASARRRGIRFGRPEIVLPSSFISIVAAYKRHEISFDEALRHADMRKSTFYARMRQLIRSWRSSTPEEQNLPLINHPKEQVLDISDAPALDQQSRKKYNCKKSLVNFLVPNAKVILKSAKK